MSAYIYILVQSVEESCRAIVSFLNLQYKGHFQECKCLEIAKSKWKCKWKWPYASVRHEYHFIRSWNL